MLHRANRLVKPADFQRVYKQGKYLVARQMVLYYCPSLSPESTRVGFVASKKVGKSVRRNRCKRLLREAMRMLLPFLNGGYDFVIVARPPLGDDGFSQVVKVMAGLLRKAGIYRRDNE